MKRIFTVIICVALFLSMCVGTSANSKIPESLMKTIKNYTAESSISVVFEDTSDVLNLLDELEIPKEIDYFIDLKMLLKSMLTDSATMKAQVDFSDDFSKIKAGMTFDNEQDIGFNANMSVGIKSKTGIWLNVDLSNASARVFDIIISMPITNKYFCLDLTEYIDEEAVSMFKGIYNKAFIDALMSYTSDILVKYVKFKETGNNITMSVDNDGFTALCDEIMAFAMNIAGGMGEQISVDLPQYKGMQLLGKNGIKAVYTISNGNITSCKETVDLSVDLSKVYEALTGEVWGYNNRGKIDMTVTVNTKISKIGNTSINYPKLTEDNSVSLNEIINESYMSYETPSYDEPTYPIYYVDVYCEELPIVNGDIYVPLRMTLESAYSDTVTIDYVDGEIKASSEYFPEFRTLTLKVGADKVYADGAEYLAGNVLLINNTTYVNSKLFTDVFGWDFAYASHNLISDEYDYVFYTQNY